MDGWMGGYCPVWSQWGARWINHIHVLHINFCGIRGKSKADSLFSHNFFFFPLSWLPTSPSPPLTVFGKMGHERHLIFFSSFHSFINDLSCWSIENSTGAFVWIPASERVAAFPTDHHCTCSTHHKTTCLVPVQARIQTWGNITLLLFSAYLESQRDAIWHINRSFYPQASR